MITEVELSGDILFQRLQVIDLLRALGAQVKDMENYKSFEKYCREVLGMHKVLDFYTGGSRYEYKQ